jgi:Phosphotransferase enzyme family
MISSEVPTVPDTLEEALSPVWLTEALALRFPGIKVTGVTPGPVISRVSTNARFRIECAGGLPDGLSPDLCVKGYFSDAGRVSRQAGVPEVSFYRDLAARSGVRTLTSVYAGIDATTLHGVVITQDVVAEGASFLDARSDYTPDQTAESLEQFAALHAATWGDPWCARADWLAPRLASTLQVRGVPEIRGNFEGPIGAGVPVSVRDPQRLADGYRKLAAEVPAEKPWTVVHGDAHVGNIYLDGLGRPSLLDWQLVQRGMWYLDVGYHIASTLTIDDRRSTEWDLLRHYLDRLAAAGVKPPSWDAARTGLRRGIIHGFFLWGITLKVEPAVISVLLERLGTAAADHDSFAAIG